MLFRRQHPYVKDRGVAPKQIEHLVRVLSEPDSCGMATVIFGASDAHSTGSPITCTSKSRLASVVLCLVSLSGRSPEEKMTGRASVSCSL